MRKRTYTEIMDARERRLTICTVINGVSMVIRAIDYINSDPERKKKYSDMIKKFVK